MSTVTPTAWRANPAPAGPGERIARAAAVNARATDVALATGNRILEVAGARATATTAGLDHFLRDVRTHTPHAPVAYQRREVGRRVLEGELPEPTWHS